MGITIFNDNLELYRPEKSYYLKSLKVAKELKDSSNKSLVFHCLWKVPREFGRKQLAVLSSIVANHAENVIIFLWSNVDLSEHHLLINHPVRNYIKFIKWDIQSEIKNTILENVPFLNGIHDDYCYLEGDLFRLLVLYKYGGFYIDMDVLVLRDMTPLNNLEFLYQWGTSGFHITEPKICMNGAIMRFNKGSAILLEYLEILSKTPPVKNSTIWGNKLYSRITQSVLVLPCIWFNSEWGFEDTHLNPFNEAPFELFDGAFTWHWHNRWDEAIHPASKFHHLELKHAKQINCKHVYLSSPPQF